MPTTTFSPGVSTISWEVGSSPSAPPSLDADCFFSLVDDDEARRAMDRGFVFVFRPSWKLVLNCVERSDLTRGDERAGDDDVCLIDVEYRME